MATYGAGKCRRDNTIPVIYRKKGEKCVQVYIIYAYAYNTCEYTRTLATVLRGKPCLEQEQPFLTHVKIGKVRSQRILQ